MKKLIVIGGATATGKTALAIHLAQWLNIEIISADSRQFFREMSIGTAKPNAEELAAAPHHFINSRSITETYSVGAFEKDALALLETLFQQQQVVIMTGGSGLYIRAVCEGLDTFPEVSEEVRIRVDEGEKQGGVLWLQQTLRELDPAYFDQVDQQNPARLRRAIEVSMQAGQPYSQFLKRNHAAARSFQPIYILLDWPRETLYQRINARVDSMIQDGLEEEARKLWPLRHLPALKTVGYEEFFDFFEGKISREDAVDKIKQHTRNYAKRQVTWFNKHGEWQRFLPNETERIQSFLAPLLT
ncbi:MAG TPA: tRNA (adenosine(37)-N6)-dimethylallyltransferase MiaA [Saprospiraceae bacterium]|nr:tRNA (adenosine(37)-N6)-dimethylallyltransferase MiaA [Saprospiraceae bacterium]